MAARDMRLSKHVCPSPLPWPLTRHQSVYILYHESGVVSEWKKKKNKENKITMLCRMGMLHQHEGIYYCQIMALVFIFLFCLNK